MEEVTTTTCLNFLQSVDPVNAEELARKALADGEYDISEDDGFDEGNDGWLLCKNGEFISRNEDEQGAISDLEEIVVENKTALHRKWAAEIVTKGATVLDSAACPFDTSSEAFLQWLEAGEQTRCQ